MGSWFDAYHIYIIDSLLGEWVTSLYFFVCYCNRHNLLLFKLLTIQEITFIEARMMTLFKFEFTSTLYESVLSFRLRFIEYKWSRRKWVDKIVNIEDQVFLSLSLSLSLWFFNCLLQLNKLKCFHNKSNSTKLWNWKLKTKNQTLEHYTCLKILPNKKSLIVFS